MTLENEVLELLWRVRLGETGKRIRYDALVLANRIVLSPDAKGNVPEAMKKKIEAEAVKQKIRAKRITLRRLAV